MNGNRPGSDEVADSVVEDNSATLSSIPFSRSPVTETASGIREGWSIVFPTRTSAGAIVDEAKGRANLPGEDCVGAPHRPLCLDNVHRRIRQRDDMRSANLRPVGRYREWGPSARHPRSPPIGHRVPRAADTRSASGSEWRWKRYLVPERAADRSREPRGAARLGNGSLGELDPTLAEQLNTRRVDLIWIAIAVRCCEVDHALNPRAQHRDATADRPRHPVSSCPCRWRPVPTPRRYGRAAGRARPACRSWGKRDWRTRYANGGRSGQGTSCRRAAGRDVSEHRGGLLERRLGDSASALAAALAASGSMPWARSVAASRARSRASLREAAGYAPSQLRVPDRRFCNGRQSASRLAVLTAGTPGRRVQRHPARYRPGVVRASNPNFVSIPTNPSLLPSYPPTGRVQERL